MKNKDDLKKLFNLNNILSQVINFAAYIILVASVVALLYISFIEKFDIKIDWLTMGIFSLAAVLLAWLNWNTFYKRQYEKIMAEDIAQNSMNKYSIHARYYMAIKDWSDVELQKKIDEFNEEYEAKWLRWVEKVTGVPIDSRWEIETDSFGNQILDENKKVKKIWVKGIKELPYRGFKHKILMWRIKNHRYPQSGYKTSMELMSLLSFQDANLNKRSLKADKSFYLRKSLTKLFSLSLTVSMTASLVPELISGNKWAALLKAFVALGSLITAVLLGAMNGVRGARIKLSIVEDACSDLERWADKKPILTPYIIELSNEPIEESKENSDQVTMNIFENSNFK